MDSWTSSSSCWIKHTDTPYWPFAALTLTQRISSLLARSRSDGAHPDEHAVEYTVVFSVWEETMVQFWSSAKKTAAPFLFWSPTFEISGNEERRFSWHWEETWSDRLHSLSSPSDLPADRLQSCMWSALTAPKPPAGFFSLSLLWIFNQTLFVFYLK